MRLSRAGDAYFVYHAAMQTTFSDPRGLPEGYDAALDDLGRMYFKNHHTRSTQWQDPRSNQQQATLALWRAEGQKRWWKEQVWREIEVQWRENEEANAREESECAPAS